MSGPGRLNFARLPSKLPWPMQVTITRFVGAARLANPVERLGDLLARGAP
jgi:hypothetical protein